MGDRDAKARQEQALPLSLLAQGGDSRGATRRASLTCTKLHLRLVPEGAPCEQDPTGDIPTGVRKGPVNGGHKGDQHPHQQPWGGEENVTTKPAPSSGGTQPDSPGTPRAAARKWGAALRMLLAVHFGLVFSLFPP